MSSERVMVSSLSVWEHTRKPGRGAVASAPCTSGIQGLESASMTGLQAELLEGLQWQEEATRLAGKGTKAIALIERLRTFVLGVYDDGVHGNRRARPDDTADRVDEQGLAKPAPLLLAIDSETAEHGGRHGIMRQPLCQGQRKFVLFEARGAQTEIAD